MITLIYGGSGSGKSAFAEDYVCSTSYSNKFYLATMHSNDDESVVRIKRHRSLRAGKGFITIEQPVDIVNAIKTMSVLADTDFSTVDKKGSISVVLLECMSNLVANEMFRDGRIHSSDEVIDKVYTEVMELSNSVDSIVIVTNNIFEDGLSYDAGTKEYLRALGRINALLAKKAQEVYEVVVGIGMKL